MGQINEMTRTDIIQAILDKISGKRYLEIGVFKRENFDKITVKEKIGADPSYKNRNKYLSKLLNWFPPLATCHKLLRRLKGERYFQVTSDRFFEDNAQWLGSNPMDVCFIDGLHTYAQSLNDVINCLKYLSPSGVIVMHDCSPKEAVLAHPANSLEDMIKMDLPGFTGGWTGDVWKTIVYLRSQRPDLRVFVLNTDEGVGIITRGKPENMLSYSIEEIDRMTYQDLQAARKELLNLKEPEYMGIFLESL
jgi:Methyltransferase domain